MEQARFDIRVLILWDGMLHALLYVIACLGLWLLWQTRNEFTARGADRRLLANALVGFGVWHILDSILSHWVLGIHRIRMDVDNPVFWDLLWFILFGIIPAVIGWKIRRSGADVGGRLMNSPLALILAVCLGGPLAALPPQDQTEAIVLFRPGIAEPEALAAIITVGGRVIASDPSGQMWFVDLALSRNRSKLYSYGAVLVTSSVLPLGCFSWTKRSSA